jgi:hypothetical protein
VIHKLEPTPLEDEDFRVLDDDGAFTEDDLSLNEDEVPFEEFTAPDFDDFESDYEYYDTNINFNDAWILLWIFKYQARFRLLNTAIDLLIKFFRMVLIDAD